MLMADNIGKSAASLGEIMSGEFFERLQKYFSKVAVVLRGEADIASIFPNPADIGTSRESIYAAVLRQHLPRSCSVFSGGYLFDMDGNESKQIDLIIINDVSPQFNFLNPDGRGRSFACIDGCVGVVSIKSMLDRSELVHALRNIASLPTKVPLEEGRYNTFVKIRDYDDWPYKIVYASDGIEMDTALETINTFYKENETIPFSKRPNIVHVSGKYNILRAWKGASTRSGKEIPENTYCGNPDTSDAYSLLATILSIQTIVLASNQVYYNYSELVNKLPVPQ